MRGQREVAGMFTGISIIEIPRLLLTLGIPLNLSLRRKLCLLLSLNLAVALISVSTTFGGQELRGIIAGRGVVDRVIMVVSRSGLLRSWTAAAHGR